jgi:hypothetical protein
MPDDGYTWFWGVNFQLTGYTEQASSSRSMQAAAGYEAEASAERTAATGSDISAAISGLAGLADLFTGGAASVVKDAFLPENNNTSLPTGSFDGSGTF